VATYVDKIKIQNDSETYTVEITADGKLKVESSPASGAGGAMQITGQNRINIAAVSATGRLLVSDEPPEPPEGTTPVDVSEVTTPIKNGGYTDTVYTITNGQTLVLERFNAGTEASLGRIELYYDPNGNGTGMTLIRVAYLNVTNTQFDLNRFYVGDGTRAIRLRSTNNTSTNNLQFFHSFSGYERNPESGEV